MKYFKGNRLDSIIIDHRSISKLPHTTTRDPHHPDFRTPHRHTTVPHEHTTQSLPIYNKEYHHELNDHHENNKHQEEVIQKDDKKIV